MEKTVNENIWFEEPNIESIASLEKGTIHDALGIKITEIGTDFLKATMPVDKRTIQPYGILHGGASVVLAESLGSVASHLVVDPIKYATVGLEVNANHLRPVRSGFVTGKVTPIHLGRKIHVWDIEIHSDRKKIICKVRLTVAVVKRNEILGH